MGTRTTVKVISNGEIIASLYRHWDGCPAETGADLIEKIQTTKYGSNFVRALLDETEEVDKTRKVYRIEETAGDIEHFYQVVFEHNCQPVIYHAARPNWDSELDWTENPIRHTLAEFTEVVNLDRKLINKRLAQLKAEQPEAYKDSEPYPMIEL